MIKLAKLTDYAVIVLAEMALQPNLLSASTLADKTGLPEPTVAKVLKKLAAQGIVSSVRGAGGGYRMEVRPASLPVTAIIAAIEGPVALTSCVEGSAEKCARAGFCVLNGRWNKVNRAVREALECITLADMMPETRMIKESVERVA